MKPPEHQSRDNSINVNERCSGKRGEEQDLGLTRRDIDHVAISIIHVVLVRVAIVHVINRMSREFD